MATKTYDEIAASVRAQCGRSVKTCWIADVKRALGLTRGIATNRIDPDKPKYPCHDSVRALIVKALTG